MARPVDTDAIIPVAGARAGGASPEALAPFLFSDWRRAARAGAGEAFVLDRPAYRKSGVLMALENFGCGSSREHAVWALQGAGMRAMIALSFGEIFAANAVRNNLVTIEMHVTRRLAGRR